ncbi:MAG TPA: carbohydrate kinase [Oscillatoriales cyanobacterium M59_W2019_021]|nr:MAG: carbohydrate kinase [Cyanobacteria bacterium J055]HIK29785.1 carbohydrate kinase [Oscillatoriales cyanobacterium M4454_W2019_049]HIK53277.1 carbohydrate kinase [Oscillatoriales cyanobacterium M59_W2019_021]
MQPSQVICVGEMLVDRLSDRPGLPLEAVDSWTDYPGGAPANVACACVKLGTPAGFVGCIGRDAPGNHLVELLADIGVETTGVQRHENAPTRIVYVVRNETGDRHFAGFGGRSPCEFADAFLDAEDIPESPIRQAEFVVVGSLELAYPHSRTAVDRVLNLAENDNTRILVDVNRRDMFWSDPGEALPRVRELVNRADFLKLTSEEAKWLFDTTDPGTICDRLHRVRGVWVTLGERGCTYAIAGYQDRIRAFNVPVVDTTGAGDAFTAGLLHRLCQLGTREMDAEIAREIARYASAVGALTVMKPGAIAAQPTATEVRDFLFDRSSGERGVEETRGREATNH